VKNVEFTKISVLNMESSVEMEFPGDRIRRYSWRDW
jgi:hypothetical protein